MTLFKIYVEQYINMFSNVDYFETIIKFEHNFLMPLYRREFEIKNLPFNLKQCDKYVVMMNYLMYINKSKKIPYGCFVSQRLINKF